MQYIFHQIFHLTQTPVLLSRPLVHQLGLPCVPHPSRSRHRFTISDRPTFIDITLEIPLPLNTTPEIFLPSNWLRPKSKCRHTEGSGLYIQTLVCAQPESAGKRNIHNILWTKRSPSIQFNSSLAPLIAPSILCGRDLSRLWVIQGH